MSTTVRVDGLKELQVKLLALGLEFGEKAAISPVRAALRKGANLIMKDARQRVRRRTGTLAENIIVTSQGAKPPAGFISMKVTVRAKSKGYKDNARNRKSGKVGGTYRSYGPLFYARFLEFGTSHQPAYPFLRPAFEANKLEALNVIKEGLAEAIDKTAAKLRASSVAR